MDQEYDVVIVGAGLAGLSAAIELEKFDLNVLIIDRSDRAGGRVKTDQQDGFLFDRGFQVYLDAYPEGKAMLDYEDLDLRSFMPGALCFDHYRKFLVSDTTRQPASLPRMALSPVGSFMDKIRMGNLAARLKSASLEEIFARPEHTTRDYLKQLRFSPKILERFFQPFFAGIFLEGKLNTSSRMFEFVFKMMSEGNTTLPNHGMETIPQQLKAKLKKTEFRFHSEVKEIKGQQLLMEKSENISARHIIIATEASSLVPQMAGKSKWQETATYYFAAEKSVLRRKVIALNYHQDQLVNNFCVISDIAPGYAPKNQHLVSVSLSRVPESSVEDVSQEIKNELSDSFGASVQDWKFLRNYHIRKALPVVPEVRGSVPISETRIREGLYLAGDQMLNGSINAAMKSGQLAAQEAVLQYRTNGK